MVRLLISNRIAVIELLLDHGLNPNGVIVFEHCAIALLPWILMMSNIHPTDIKSKYMQLAMKTIEYGAQIEYPELKGFQFSESARRKFEVIQSNGKKVGKKQEKQICKTFADLNILLYEGLNYQSAFVTFIQYNMSSMDPQVFDSFMEKSSLENIALGLVYIMAQQSDTQVLPYFSIGGAAKIEISEDRERLRTLAGTRSTPSNSIRLLYGILLTKPKDECSKSFMMNLEKLSARLNASSNSEEQIRNLAKNMWLKTKALERTYLETDFQEVSRETQAPYTNLGYRARAIIILYSLRTTNTVEDLYHLRLVFEKMGDWAALVPLDQRVYKYAPQKYTQSIKQISEMIQIVESVCSPEVQLRRAANAGDLDVVRQIIVDNSGLNVSEPCPNSGKTATELATQNQHVEIAKYLDRYVEMKKLLEESATVERPGRSNRP
jgi:hypothetical protein